MKVSSRGTVMYKKWIIEEKQVKDLPDEYLNEPAIKRLLETALGITPNDIEKKKDEFKEFYGIWTRDDLKGFNNFSREFEHVDPEDWR